jgi:hypothetical protein
MHGKHSTHSKQCKQRQAKTSTASENAAFMRLLVDAGFGMCEVPKTVKAASVDAAFVVESPTSFAKRATGKSSTADVVTAAYIDINNMPPTKYKMPRMIPIRFKPNQNVTTRRFEPAFKPYGSPVKNQINVFDTLAEQRDFLHERYLEAIERVRDERQEKLDARLEKHEELLKKQAEVAPSWRRLQDPMSAEEADEEADEQEAEDTDNG